MSARIYSQGGLVLATAMVVSSTVIFLTFSSRQKTLQTLPSCLSSSEGKKRYNKKKKKVKFAENVKETNGNGKEYRKEQRKLIAEKAADGPTSRFCRNKIPANRIALYNGIMRDRVHNMASSY